MTSESSMKSSEKGGKKGRKGRQGAAFPWRDRTLRRGSAGRRVGIVGTRQEGLQSFNVTSLMDLLL